MPPEREWDLEGHVSEISEQRQRLVRCETLLAQSIVFHALDYAESLGFPPHRDFEPALFEPRPEALLETPWCLPERPYYVAGPSDDVPRTLLQLLRIVDYDFDYVIPEYLMPAWFVADDDGDDDYDDDHDYDDDFEDDEEARIDPDADRPHSDRQAQAPAASGEIDWARACQGVPVDDLFEGIDLGEDFGLEQAVQTLESALENGSLLQWEAIIRNEQGLGCTEAHEDALDELLSFANEEREDERILWIDEIARPAEPWYASVRRLAPLLVVERFETWQSYPDDFETRGVRLLERFLRTLSICRYQLAASDPRTLCRPSSGIIFACRRSSTRSAGSARPLAAKKRALPKNRIA
jgi:hypothetical protein